MLCMTGPNGNPRLMCRDRPPGDRQHRSVWSGWRGPFQLACCSAYISSDLFGRWSSSLLYGACLLYVEQRPQAWGTKFPGHSTP